MMVLLPLIGLVTPKQAFLGLSSNAVVSIIAVIIIGAGLDKTGVMNKVASPIIKLGGRSEKRIMALISGTVAVISSMMQNIGAAALFLPATQRISKRLDIPISRLLMPMGFCAIIGGTMTLVGASPTILLNDLMVLGGKKLEPFGLFTQTPIGICLVISAIIYFMILGKFILPAAKGEADLGTTAMLITDYPALDHPFELHVPDTFDGRKTLEELAIRQDFLVSVVALGSAATGSKRLVPRRTDSIGPGDDLVIIGREVNVRRLAEIMDWQIKDGLDYFADEFARTNAGLAETVVTPRSELIGKTLSEAGFQEKYRVNPIAVYTGGRVYYSGLKHVRLNMGDALLLQGPWDRFHRLRNQPQPRALTFASPLEGEILRPEKAKLAVVWLAVALAQIIFFKMQLSVALMSGALGMIITGVLTVDEGGRGLPIGGLDDGFSPGWAHPSRICLRTDRYSRLHSQDYTGDNRGSATDSPSGGGGSHDLFLYPGDLQCGRYRASGPPLYEHGAHGRRRSEDGCAGGGSFRFQHLCSSHPPPLLRNPIKRKI
jgi:di/tricarboxylate transporter